MASSINDTGAGGSWYRDEPDEPLAEVQVASGYRREADVLREAAEAYATQWRSAARLGQAVDLPPTQASFVAWLEARATALEQAQPLPAAAPYHEDAVEDWDWTPAPVAAISEVESLEPVEPLLVPTGPPRDPHAATVPFEAFVGDHPDHIDWVRDTGRCMATGPHECVTGASAEGQERSEEQQ